MSSRFSMIAAALGLVLATGIGADASAKPVTRTHHVHAHAVRHVVKAPHGVRIVHKHHRIPVAHLRHEPKRHVTHLKGHSIVKAGLGAKSTGIMR